MSISVPLNPTGPDLTNQVTKEGHPIGCGAYSDVFRGNLRTSDGEREVAIKVFRTSTGETEFHQKTKQYIARESLVWSGLQHPNILRFYGFFYDSTISLTSILVSEYCTNGSVLDYLKGHPNTDRKAMIIGVARGLCYLHDQDYFHGDLKANNILVNRDGAPLICDFGRSKINNVRGFTTVTEGNARYLAPEQIDMGEVVAAKKPLFKPSKESDVFAFGMVSLEILTGEKPFFYLPDVAVPVQMVAGTRPKWERYYDVIPTNEAQIRHAIEMCWEHEPTKRATIHEVLEGLGG